MSNAHDPAAAADAARTTPPMTNSTRLTAAASEEAVAPTVTTPLYPSDERLPDRATETFGGLPAEGIDVVKSSKRTAPA